MTEADQRRAAEIADALSEVLDDSSGLYPAGVEIIAAALAEEWKRAYNQGALDGMKLMREHREVTA